MIELKNFDLIIDGKPILSNINLSFKENELVCVVGASGAGKTSLMNQILNNETSNNYNSIFKNEQIAPIFQEFTVFPRLKVTTNVLIAKLHEKNKLDALFLDFKKNEIDAAIDCLKVVDMQEHAKKKAKALSGGEKQRVAIARALYQEADVILADEPTSSLDLANANEIMNIFKKLVDSKLVICVSHDLNLAFKYADRIIHVDNGKIQLDVKNTSENKNLIKEIYEKI